MVREGGFCPPSGRVDESIWNGQAEPDTLEVAHIISQSHSEGIRGGSEAARQEELIHFPKSSYFVNYTEAVSTFQN